jgi:hypothetical protein
MQKDNYIYVSLNIIPYLQKDFDENIFENRFQFFKKFWNFHEEKLSIETTYFVKINFWNY